MTAVAPRMYYLIDALINEEKGYFNVVKEGHCKRRESAIYVPGDRSPDPLHGRDERSVSAEVMAFAANNLLEHPEIEHDLLQDGTLSKQLDESSREKLKALSKEFNGLIHVDLTHYKSGDIIWKDS